MEKVSPCMTCSLRRPGCHDLCEAYKGWAEAQYAAKRKSADAYYARQYIPDSIRKRTYGKWLDEARRGRGKIT